MVFDGLPLAAECCGEGSCRLCINSFFFLCMCVLTVNLVSTQWLSFLIKLTSQFVFKITQVYSAAQSALKKSSMMSAELHYCGIYTGWTH